MFGSKMSTFNAILFIFLTVLTFTEATALNPHDSFTKLHSYIGRIRPMNKATRPPFDERTDKSIKRSLLFDPINLVNLTDLDDIDKRGISEGKRIMLPNTLEYITG